MATADHTVAGAAVDTHPAGRTFEVAVGMHLIDRTAGAAVDTHLVVHKKARYKLHYYLAAAAARKHPGERKDLDKTLYFFFLSALYLFFLLK
jgi:hypothetical protein